MKDEIKCTLCSGKIVYRYVPMKDWGISGFLCGTCYSKKIFEHYPGEHARVNLDK